MKHILSLREFLTENINNFNPYIFDNKEIVDKIEYSIESDGSSFICTYVASAVRMLLGDDNVKIYGFSTGENPDAEYFYDEEDFDEGHHFAVYNNRYIIDPWIYNNDNYETNTIFDRCVFDLQNTDDDDIIRYVYGDKNNWTDISKRVDYFKELFPKTSINLLDYFQKF